MNKTLKKLLALFLAISIFNLGSLCTYAQSTPQPNASYETYMYYVDNGYISEEELPYFEWAEMVEHSIQSIEFFQENENFELIYSGPSLFASSITLQPGDVILTTHYDTALLGLIGHAGIATNKNYIFHIAGTGETPTYISYSYWLSKYYTGRTDIYRCSSSSVAQSAANWCVSTYAGSNAEYSLATDLYETNKVYCSKLVWQGYYFGAGSSHASFPIGIPWIAPYDLPTYIYNLSHFDTVYP